MVAALDASLARGLAFLVAQQGEDGGFHSTVYSAFQDGTALTPPIVKALAFSPVGDASTRAAFERGTHFLHGIAGPPAPAYLPYPLYTHALGTLALLPDGSPEAVPSRAHFAALLQARQLVEATGWPATDPSHGGWAYFDDPKRPPEPVPDLSTGNLPATLAAIAALQLAGVPKEAPAMLHARAFVERCQNFAPEGGDPAWDDGGFFMSPANEPQNKAMGGVDRAGRPRYRSYGTMTAEGLRALLRLGLPADHPRVVAARDWLVRHFDAAGSPGAYPAARELQRRSVRHYWAWSAAHAIRALGAAGAMAAPERRRLLAALAGALLKEQRPDGSFVNAWADMREDDPLVATPLALAAIALCRMELASPLP